MTRATLLTVSTPTGSAEPGDVGFVIADFGAPQVRITDLAVTRGDGVFETIAVIDGHPQALEPHLARLAHSAALLDLPEPAHDVWRAAVRRSRKNPSHSGIFSRARPLARVVGSAHGALRRQEGRQAQAVRSSG